jgi:signal transduction histidine kinase
VTVSCRDAGAGAALSAADAIVVLLVEDSASDALLLREALADALDLRHELVHVTQLAEAKARLRAERFDVVLLDLGLPDSQGAETYRDLAREAPDLPVIVLTALDDHATGLHAVQEGAQDYLIKQQLETPLLERALRYGIERHRLTADLRHSRDRLRMLAARLQEVREEERTRISREVHDELGQKLSGLKMDLHWLETRLATLALGEGAGAIHRRIVDGLGLADGAIDAVQRIAIELRPSSLDYLGLADAIRDESRRFAARSSIRMSLDLPDTADHVPKEIATTCFRILQELLTNVARHAAAGNVAIHLRADDTELAMEVRDDGVGMAVDAAARSNSLGLLGMQERAASRRGRIVFDSAPGEGTRATVTIPLPGA